MNIEITRKQVAALARALKRPDSTYLQTMDTIAVALGFENQAALMVRLNAPGPARAQPAPADAEGKQFRAIVAFGDQMTNALQRDELITEGMEGELKFVEFSSREEHQAYLTGLEAADKWWRHDVAVSRSHKAYWVDERPGFFDEPRADPAAEFAAWHNQQILKALWEEAAR